MKSSLAIFAIITLALFVRLYGLNWDQGQHLHPDERFLTMVTIALKWPLSLSQYFDTAASPLNPHNAGFSFFVYGTFPLLIVKAIAESLSLSDYVNLTLVGRMVSALLDTGTVILVYFITKEINPKYKTLNSKQYQNVNQQNSKRINHLNIENCNLFRISDFGFRIFPLLASFFYVISVLPIQLSHFYAVDTFLTFFVALSFYLLIKIIQLKIHNSKFIILNSLLGVSFALALASKISAMLFLPIILLSFLFKSLHIAWKNRSIFSFFFVGLLFTGLFLLSTIITFRLAQPYLFTGPMPWDIHLNPKVIDNWNQLQSFDDPKGGFPPGVQWITTKPYLFPLKNLLFWGLGLPLGVLSVLAVVYVFIENIYLVWRNGSPNIRNSQFAIRNLILLWIVILFCYQGSQFVKAMRYFYPIYPFLSILAAFFFVQGYSFLYQFLQVQSSKFKVQSNSPKFKNNFKFLIVIFNFSLFTFNLLPAAAFLSIYSRPHSRVAASEWIYQHIPAGSTLSSEHWDDALPLTLPNHDPRQYKGMEFTLYYPDSETKWQEMADKLNQVDYLVLTSNRLYGSLMTVPEKFPITSRYYQKLFDGSLGFSKVAEFTSRPNLPIPFIHTCLTPPGARYGIVALPTQECNLPGLTLVDDYADESFTVYDHPKVIIFKKVTPVDYLQVLTY